MDRSMTHIKIGPYTLPSVTLLAPMAGVTDLPFRKLCHRLGAGLVVSEMVTSDYRLWNSRKSQLRLQHSHEIEPRSVQIAGSDPEMMAHAAQLNVQQGAQIIDINLGCPAKKVCKKAAGSALLRDEPLVERILQRVVDAVEVPVTLKMRTGWNPDNRNGVRIAEMAQACGISALAVHGRTRACAYQGAVEYDTIAAIKRQVTIPVIANGDIDSPEKALWVMEKTGADGVMIGRAAQGKPWLFRQINHFLATQRHLEAPTTEEVRDLLLEHLDSLYCFYGETMGIRIARKHVGWYLQSTSEGTGFRKQFNQLETCAEQIANVHRYFERLTNGEEMAA